MNEKMIQKDFAYINGTKIYYEVAGRGKALVLVHGFTLDHRMWDDQFVKFSSFNKVIRYDMRGFGKSALPTSDAYSHAIDLRCLLEFLNIKSANVLGFSMGGEVALDFALNFSGILNSLILVDSWLSGYPGTGGRSGFKMTNLKVEDAKKIWFEHPIFDTIRFKQDLFLKIEKIVSDYKFWHSNKKDPAYKLFSDAKKFLPKIDKPVLIIIGQYDLPDYHAIAKILYDEIGNCQKVIIENSGHITNIEAPEKFYGTVKNFIEKI